MAYKSTDYEPDDFFTSGEYITRHLIPIKWIIGRVEVRRNGIVIASRSGRIPYHIPKPVKVIE